MKNSTFHRSLRAAVAFALSLTLAAGTLAGCGGSKAPASSGGDKPAATEKKDAASGGSEAKADKPADAAAGSAAVDWKPDLKTITFRVSNAAGGTADLKCRAIAAAVQEATGTTALVQNLPGGNGTIMAADLDSYDPSACELMIGTEALFAAAPVFGKDVTISLDDYEILFGMPLTAPSVLAVSSKLGVKTWDEFLKYAEGKTLNIACSPRPGMTWIQTTALMGAAGLSYEVVTDGAANKNILTCQSGDADAVMANTAALKDYVASGEMVALVQLSGKTYDNKDVWGLDPIPSVVDVGYPDIVIETTSFMCVRKGADPAGVEAMTKIITDYLASDKGIADMAAINTDSVTISAEETAQRMADELELFKTIKEKYVK